MFAKKLRYVREALNQRFQVDEGSVDARMTEKRLDPNVPTKGLLLPERLRRDLRLHKVTEPSKWIHV